MQTFKRPATGDENELAPDLEWLLQSGQANGAELAQILVEEFYVPLYRLALSLLDDPDEAAYATLKALVTVQLNLYSYQNGHAPGVDSAHLWLYRTALEVFQSVATRLRLKRRLKASLPLLRHPGDLGASTPGSSLEASLWLALDHLDAPTRLVVLLAHLHGWSVPQITSLLRSSETRVRSRLEGARRALAAALEQDGFSARDLPEGDLEVTLARSLSARWPSPQTDEAELQAIASEVASQASQQGEQRRRFTTLQESLLVGVGTLLAIFLFWGASQVLSEPTPTPAVITKIVMVRPTRLVVVTPTPTPAAGEIYTIQEGDTLEGIAARYGLEAGYLFRLNRLLPGSALQPGQKLLIYAGSPGPTPTPLRPMPQPDILDINSTSLEIQSRLVQQERFWRTRWLDLQLVHYGPPGYVGPPQSLHVQVWYSRDPNDQLILAGRWGYPVEVAVLYHNYNELYVAQPGGDLAPFFSVNKWPSNQLFTFFSTQLSPLASSGVLVGPPESLLDFTLQVRGSQRVAGRQALIVDLVGANHLRQARLWVDTLTGTVLRDQQYGGPDYQTLVWEYMVNRVAYDVEFPPDLLDPRLPWRGDFAADATGKPLPADPVESWIDQEAPPGHQHLDYRLPPPGFDPSTSQLTFQFPEDFQWGTPWEPASNLFVDLFAGPYYLGKLDFPPSWEVHCARSPDGRKVAFTYYPWGIATGAENIPLTWFDLLDLTQTYQGLQNPRPADVPRRTGVLNLTQVHQVFQNAIVTNFAFAPDSRSLEILAHNDQAIAVYLLNMDSGEITRLREVSSAFSLAESPAGVQFPAKMGGLEACSPPPKS